MSVGQLAVHKDQSEFAVANRKGTIYRFEPSSFVPLGSVKIGRPCFGLAYDGDTLLTLDGESLKRFSKEKVVPNPEPIYQSSAVQKSTFATFFGGDQGDTLQPEIFNASGSDLLFEGVNHVLGRPSELLSMMMEKFVQQMPKNQEHETVLEPEMSDATNKAITPIQENIEPTTNFNFLDGMFKGMILK
jgi:hypothetical protein